MKEATIMTLYKKGALPAALGKLGIQNLRPWQEAPLAAILQGEDIFASAPTGGGKSLLFQLPAIMEDGKALTIVISPLRALQADQVIQLQQKGVKAVMLNSDLNTQERWAVLNDLPKIALLYTTPEQLCRQDLLSALEHCCVARVAIDEAHILPQAMLGFRKAYARIDEFLASLPQRPQVIACTATATTKARKRILKALGITEADVFTLPVRRKNLHLKIKEVEGNKKGPRQQVLFHAVDRALQKWERKGKKGSVIIYAPTVKGVKSICEWLRGREWNVRKYTGKMTQEKRMDAQRAFQSGEVPIIIATNAFGLGINKPDIRLIIHAGMPLSMSGYVQEIGRAGRDGQKARCLLFYSKEDYARNKSILNYGTNRESAHMAIGDLDSLKELLDSKKCLWCCIEKYFGEKPGKCCKKCYRCKIKE